FPTALMQSLDHARRDSGEQTVALDRVRDFDLRQLPKRRFEATRHDVGVLGVAQPAAVLEHSDPGGGEKSHFRSELAALFAAIIKFLRQLAIEKHHRFSYRDAIFRAAETQYIDTGSPSDFLGRDPKRGDRICKPRAVHLH